MDHPPAITIREGTPDDADALGELIVASFQSAPSALYEADELGRAAYIGHDVTSAAASDDELLLVALVGHRLVAMSRVIPREFARSAHVATVGVVVRPGYRRLGIGHALLSETERRAEAWPKVRRIEMRVAAHDHALRALLAAHAWEPERVEIGALMTPDGAVDLAICVRDALCATASPRRWPSL